MSRKKSASGIFSGIGLRIREIRGKLTQVEFGEILGVAQGTINKYENELIFPGEDILRKIAAYARINIEWLLHGAKIHGPTKFNIQAGEYAPEPYDTRPAILNIDNLVRANFLTRQFLKSRRPPFTGRQEAELSAYLYEYLESEHEDPGEVVISRLADLIQKREG